MATRSVESELGAIPLGVELRALVAEVLAEHNFPGEEIERASSAVVMRLQYQFGGQLLYFQMNYRERIEGRNRAIVDEFDGSNYAELAAKHGINVKQVYRIIRTDVLARRSASGSVTSKGVPK